MWFVPLGKVLGWMAILAGACVCIVSFWIGTGAEKAVEFFPHPNQASRFFSEGIIYIASGCCIGLLAQITGALTTLADKAERAGNGAA